MAKFSSDRRRLLSALTGGLLATMGVLVVTPVIAFVAGPLRRARGDSSSAEEFSDAGLINSIPAGAWTLIPIEIIRQDGWAKTTEARSVWVLRNGATSRDIKILSPICTHLGCPVAWQATASQFQCPCHGGVFSADGTHISGPPRRGLDPLEFEIRGDHLWVRWQDFQICTPTRIPQPGMLCKT